MAEVFLFDFHNPGFPFNGYLTYECRVAVTDDPIGNRSELLRARRHLDYLQTNLSDMEIEVRDVETVRMKYSKFAKPATFRYRKTFAKINRAIAYLEAKIAVWEVQSM